MIDLLTSVLDAHGGVDRWARVDTPTARLSIGGPFWGRKGWPKIFGDQTTLELDARRQHVVVTPFDGVDRRLVFDVDPERIVLHTNDGIAVDRRDDPRASFAGFQVTTQWDALQVGYFISYACWNSDYAVEVNGDVLVAQYQYEPTTFQGLTLPTQRRVHRRSPDGIADRSQTSITIDVADIAVDFHEQLPSIEKVHRETSYT
jgi:hypothetical protein